MQKMIVKIILVVVGLLIVLGSLSFNVYFWGKQKLSVMLNEAYSNGAKAVSDQVSQFIATELKEKNQISITIDGEPKILVLKENGQK